MKNVITLLSCAVALVMTSCTLSNEEKAEKLVKETLKDYLYHPDSYEPISTRVDSMFIDVTTIEPIMKISDEIKNLISKINRCERKIELAESSMDIFAPNGYSSQYSRGEYSRAKKEKEEAKSDLNKYTKKLSEQLAFLKENVAKYHKGEFTGWAVSHRFRSLNGAGSMTRWTEYICVPRESIAKLIRHNGACIAVGTTSVRTLESLYYIGLKLSRNPDLTEEELHVNQWEPYEHAACCSPLEALQHIADYLNRHQLPALHTSTQIIIAPGYTYHIVKAIVTNFHQPKSTLLLLVSAFVGEANWRSIYNYALDHEFRFLSYGDSSLLIP